METKQLDDLIRIAAAGGGLVLNGAVRSTADLVKIAAAASGTGARLFIKGAWGKPTDDLVRIAAAGRGAIVFE